MKAYIKKIPGVRGFISTTYAVFQNDNLLAIFPTKKEAERFIAVING